MFQKDYIHSDRPSDVPGRGTALLAPAAISGTMAEPAAAEAALATTLLSSATGSAAEAVAAAPAPTPTPQHTPAVCDSKKFLKSISSFRMVDTLH